jgi:hypothetical protein
MTELLEALASPWNFLWAVIVFGFAPGFCLRLIVLAYPSDDPRRRELIAELYAVPRSKQPLWVAQQLEVALFEGLANRVSAAIRRRTARRRARPKTKKRVKAVFWTRQRWTIAGVVVVGVLLLVSERNAATGGTVIWVVVIFLTLMMGVLLSLVTSRPSGRRSRGRNRR